MFLKKIFSKPLTSLSLIILLPLCLLSAPYYSQTKLRNFAHLMPKATLHVHLEGSIAPTTIMQLAQKNKASIPFKNKTQFQACCQFSSFDAFVAFYKKIIGCLKTPDDYKRIAYEYGKECARQNIRYSEVIFSLATSCMLTGLDWKVIVQALNTGRAKAHKEFGISWNWVFDLTRTKFFQPEKFVDILIQARQEGFGLVAMGLSETIVTHQVAEYQHVFDKAIAANLPIIPHVGEFEGPKSISNALSVCKAPRIDHGVRCIEDQKLVLKLAQEQIPLDVCITSNVRLGVVPNYKQHPIRRLWDAGLLITIGADDPPLFGSDLNQEYDHLIDDYHFTIDELERVSLNGITASLLPSQEKKSLMQKFKSEFVLLRKKVFGTTSQRASKVGSPL